MTANATDSGMVRMMIIVMGALVLFTLLCVTVARYFGIADGDDGDPLMRAALVERIQPVGAVRTSLDAPADSGATEVAAVEMSVEDLFNGACVACHGDPGLPNAPKVGDEAWASREGGDIAALTASAIAGKGAQMPARGGSNYTDEQIRQVVEYLVGQ